MIDLHINKNEWDGKFDVRFRVTREQLDILKTIASDFLEQVTLEVRENHDDKCGGDHCHCENDSSCGPACWDEEEDHSCDVVDVSDGPCGDVSHDKPPVQFDPGDVNFDNALKSIIKVAKEKCPDCKSGYQIERTNSVTKNTFIGCTNFPNCKFSKRGGQTPTPDVSKEPYCGCYEDLYDVDACSSDDFFDDGPGGFW